MLLLTPPQNQLQMLPFVASGGRVLVITESVDSAHAYPVLIFPMQSQHSSEFSLCTLPSFTDNRQGWAGQGKKIDISTGGALGGGARPGHGGAAPPAPPLASPMYVWVIYGLYIGHMGQPLVMCGSYIGHMGHTWVTWVMHG